MSGAPQARQAGEPRWIAALTWLAVFAPLPYSVSRLLWAAGVPVGIDEQLLREFHAPGWGSLYILFLALLADGAAIFTHVFVRSRARHVPRWIPVLGGRPVRPRVVIALLLMPIALLLWRGASHLPLVLDGFRIPDEMAGVPEWSLWTQIGLVWVWGVALCTATIAYHRATRAWPPAARC